MTAHILMNFNTSIGYIRKGKMKKKNILDFIMIKKRLRNREWKNNRTEFTLKGIGVAVMANGSILLLRSGHRCHF